MRKEVTIDKCKGCGRVKRIVYKKGWLCSYCNALRLKKRQKTKSFKSFNWNHKFAKKLRNVSKKEANNKQLLQQVYKEIDNERLPICSGCGSSNYPLSHSHLIPRSKRKDLEIVKENIVFDCLSIGDHKGCHDKWEGRDGKDLMSLKDIHNRLNYIKIADPIYYEFIFHKIKPFIK